MSSESPFKWNSEYNWERLHDDLENDKAAGVYGGPNATYFGLAGLRAGVDMAKFHKHRSADECYNPDLDKYLKNPHTRRRWEDCITLDPLGMYATRPTMAATTCHMAIPELLPHLERDGVVVRKEDGAINAVKCAVDYVWNVPRFAQRVGLDETEVRKALAEYTNSDEILDPSVNAFLPPTGGMTVYFVGDINKLSDKSTEVAVRVHDQCTGSDVFSTDICTCRPYLVFAMRAAAECAQRGGVGVIVYFQKEGRSLGEVTKFRVYNARKRQEGGDRAEKYFYQTESIAGIRDARFQEMMPDVLLWLGITRIDWLLSMSSEKYDAITSAGIEVMQRVSLPEHMVPMGAHVEINAKISAGYHSETMHSEAVIAELRELPRIRERCGAIYDLAKEGNTTYLALNEDKIGAAEEVVMQVIQENYPDGNIPYHSRWQHFKPGSVEELEASWHCDPAEAARRKLDLAFVSVLLDAGAGPVWKYLDRDGNIHRRSEGLAVASLDMFRTGMFSSDRAMPYRVNSLGLRELTEAQIEKGLQVNENTNPMVGVTGRFKILRRLGKALDKFPEFFGHEMPRPGNIVDYLARNADADKNVSIETLWRAIIVGLESIWPESVTNTIRRGDIWEYKKLIKVGSVGSDLVPFHKLSQWLTYSLLEPLEAIGYKFTNLELMTGLAEYRNGGLFVDTGVIEFKDPDMKDLVFDVGSELVIEWRALTVILLDKLHERIRNRLGKSPEEYPLVKTLQGGTWAAGRRLAKEARPETGAPPILIRSDGSVF